MAQDKDSKKHATAIKASQRRPYSSRKPSVRRRSQGKGLRLLLDTDEPPIIINGGGSLHLELPVNPASGRPKQLVQVSATGQNPITYEITEERNRALERVFVVIQPKALSPVTTYDTRTLAEGKNCIIKIWLQLLRSMGGEFDYETLDAPDIVIQGPNPQTGARTRIEIIRRGAFGTRARTHKRIWPGRHDLLALPRHFRIGKVQILEGDNTTLLKEFSEDNGYQIYFTFHHS